jgi:hypothetical protein
MKKIHRTMRKHASQNLSILSPPRWLSKSRAIGDNGRRGFSLLGMFRISHLSLFRSLLPKKVIWKTICLVIGHRLGVKGLLVSAIKVVAKRPWSTTEVDAQIKGHFCLHHEGVTAPVDGRLAKPATIKL